MKNNPINTGRLLLFCVFQIMSAPFYANGLSNNEVLYINACAVGAIQQSQSQIHGKIIDSNGMPLAGVSIIVKGTQRGTTSDFNGGYTLDVNDNQVLVFSFVGFKTQEIPVHSRNELNVIMEPEIMSLDTVEINAGYYRVKDRERTGSIATIKAQTIEKQPVNNPLAAMQGHLSGVNVVQTTGVPGGGYNIEIRGKNFINGGTEPLYIVNGVPYGSQSLGAFDVSGSINNGNISPLNAINPNDIESIEVLKDADATAIYGARGANGVVLITTKKGKAGTTKVSVNWSSTLGHVSHFLDLMNTEQYLEVRREAVSNDGSGAFLENPAFDFIWPDLKTWDQSRYTDWQKELIGGTAYRNKVQLSVSGGSEQTQFLISGGYQKETTVFPGNSNYKKASVHNTINHQSKDGRFKITMSTNYTYEDNQLPRTDFTNTAYLLEPNAPALYDAEGNLNWENNTWDNPLASLEEDYRARVHTLMGNTSVSYHILTGLEFKTNLGYNTYTLESYRTLPSTSRNPKFGFTPENYSSLTTNSAMRQSWIVEPQLNWEQQWKHLKLEVLMGTTFQRQTTEQFVQKGNGFPNNSLLLNLAAANTLEVRQDTDSKYSYHALFGRIHINWMNKYYLNLTGRRDGSSRFGPGRQYGNFGAVGVAWLFTEESFLKGDSILSFGKLRGSYGTTGSDNIGDYRFLDTYSVTGNDYNGLTTLEPTGIFNPIFGWETTKKFEVALELGFFKDRLRLNTSWYQNRSSNQLVGIPLAATTGFGSLTGNFDATVENTGLEVDLRASIIKNKNFQWSTTFNITMPKNKLVSFPGLETSTFANKLITGKPLTIVHLYHALGVDPDTGIYQFEDYNGDSAISSLEDRQWIEDFAPKCYGGIGNTMIFKNLTLDVFFQFKKQKAFNYLNSQATVGFKKNAPVELLDRWQEPGDIAPIQRATNGRFPGAGAAGQKQSQSNAAVANASFIRLRNISLTYKVPKNKSFGKDLSVYLQGQNLLTISGYNGPDPEQPLNYILPPLRQITLGLQLGF